MVMTVITYWLTKECSFENEPNQIQNETGTDAAAAAAAFAAAHI